MPNKKISQLDQITSVAGTEVVPVVQGGVVKRTTPGAFTGRLKELARAANATAIQDAKEVGRSTLIDGLSAGAVMQQDLKAVSSALHRSPNAVTAMFVYDTSKDSDGGAWTKRCQHTSWYNEPLSGKWLGAHTNETSARNHKATLGADRITNGTFSTDLAGWTSIGTVTSSATGGVLNISGVNGDGVYQNFAVEAGKTYELRITFLNKTAAAQALIYNDAYPGGAPLVDSGNNTTLGEYVVSFVAATTGTFHARIWMRGTGSAQADNISVKEVVAINTTSNDYYQLTTDGKFYRLYKNTAKYSEEFNNSVWTTFNASAVLDGTSAPTEVGPGKLAYKIVPNTTNAVHRIVQSNTSGTFASVYVRAGGYNYVKILTGNSVGFQVNLTNGTVTAQSAGITPVVQALANGWYRIGFYGASAGLISISADNAVSTNLNWDNSGFPYYAGDGVSGVYVYAAQVEYGSSATAYELKRAGGSVSEVFRGNKAEFPSLVGIVAEATNVTLYDLTEAGMPMWMRFSSGGQSFNYVLSAAAGNTPNVTSLSASNGLFVIGGAADNGSPFVDLIKDNIKLYSQSIPISPNIKTVSGRNNTLGRAYNCPPSDAYLGISRQNNSVSTAVLPSTPIDAATGLQLPSTAIATGGGISLVKNGTTIYNSTQTTSFDKVYLTPKVLIASRIGDSTLYYYPNPANISANFTLLTEATGAVDFNQGNTATLALKNRAEFARSSGSKIQLLKNNETTVAKGAAATITPTYNTGYMVGDIKRSYLTSVAPGTVSSTAFAARSLFLDDTTKGIWLDPSDLGTMFQDAAGATPVTAVEQQVKLILDKSKGLALGQELITNGNFSGGVTGWSYTVAGTSTASISNGVATITKGDSYAYITQNLLTAGKTYSVTLDVVSITGTAVVVNNSATAYATFTSTGTKKFMFRHADAATSTFYLGANSGTVVFDNISVKEVLGNHAYAPSDAARPTLSALYNLLTKTESFDDGPWTRNDASKETTTVLSPTGTSTALLIKEFATTNYHGIYQNISLVPNQQYKISWYVKKHSRRYGYVGLVYAVNSGAIVQFDFDTQTIVYTGAAATYTASNGSITAVGDGWYLVSGIFSSPVAQSYAICGTASAVWTSGGTAHNNTFTGDTSQGIYIWGASLVPADQAGLPYQRVNTATDYDSDITKFPRYLKFSGAQSLQTNSIDFSYTDKMFVSAGVRKLMTSGVGIVAETSSNADITNGAFNVAAPVSSEDYYASHRNGGILAVRGIDEPALLSPVSNVFTTVFGLTGVNSTEIGLRINGIPKTTFSRTEGTASSGFYGSHPLFIGSRNNSQHFFNGQLSQLLIAGCAVTTKQIQDAENYIEQKTYGTYPEFLVDASGNQVVDALGNPLYANVTYQY